MCVCRGGVGGEGALKRQKSAKYPKKGGSEAKNLCVCVCVCVWRCVGWGRGREGV